MVVSSVFTSIAIFIFMLYYVLCGKNNRIEVFSFLTLYIVTTNIFNYYLIKSKIIKYDSDFLYIFNGDNNFDQISIKDVVRINRTYHYFYTIHYIKSEVEEKVVFFISPNPPFSKSNKVKEILHLAKK